MELTPASAADKSGALFVQAERRATFGCPLYAGVGRSRYRGGKNKDSWLILSLQHFFKIIQKPGNES